MKKTLTLLLLIFATNQVFAQEDYMDIIAAQACECIENMPETDNAEQANMNLGLCLLEACWPYKEEIKRDYGIDMDRIDVEGERLGQIVGVKVGMKCPQLLLKASKVMEEETEDETDLQSIKGEITKVEDDVFVVFSLKDPSGKISKYYWFSFFSTNMELTANYKETPGKTVVIDYQVMELFDPRIEQYRSYNIIVGMAFEN